MSESADLASADLQALLELIGDAKDDEPGPALPWAVFSGLLAVIPCTDLAFNERRPIERKFVITQGMTPGELGGWAVYDIPSDDPFWTAPGDGREQFGRGAAWRASEDPKALRLLKTSDAYQRHWLGAVDLMSVRLPAPSGTVRSLDFFREDGYFTFRDQAVLTLLRPHLGEIHLMASRRRAGIPALTGREWEVIRLAAGGLTNQQIAHVLFTSVSTVRKHLEHIYDKTGARSRSGAVARLMPPAGV